MRRIIPLIALFLCAAAVAQESWLVPFAVRYQPDITGFNAAFASHGLPEARTRHYGWGIELRSLVGSLLVGPMYLRAWDDVENEDYHLRTDASAVLVEAGVKIAPLSFLTIVPGVGIGGLSQSFSIRSMSGDVSLDSLLVDPGRNATVQTGMKLAGMASLELGLATNVGEARYGLALRGGYLYSPLSPGWHLSNGARVLSPPDARVGGPFFTLGILLMPAVQTQTSRP